MDDYQKTIIPAWFTRRMSEDDWYFGLLLVTGTILHITSIYAVREAADGTIWIDAMMEEGKYAELQKKHMYAPTSRLDVSINASHIVAAFELADT